MTIEYVSNELRRNLIKNKIKTRVYIGSYIVIFLTPPCTNIFNLRADEGRSKKNSFLISRFSCYDYPVENTEYITLTSLCCSCCCKGLKAVDEYCSTVVVSSFKLYFTPLELIFLPLRLESGMFCV